MGHRLAVRAAGLSERSRQALAELADALLRVMDSPLRPEHGPERKANPVRRRLADTARARDLIGFRAQIDLDAGLRDLVAWWRAEQALNARAAV